jgi:hypothetical protein
VVRICFPVDSHVRSTPYGEYYRTCHGTHNLVRQYKPPPAPTPAIVSLPYHPLKRSMLLFPPSLLPQKEPAGPPLLAMGNQLISVPALLPVRLEVLLVQIALCTSHGIIHPTVRANRHHGTPYRSTYFVRTYCISVLLSSGILSPGGRYVPSASTRIYYTHVRTYGVLSFLCGTKRVTNPNLAPRDLG